MATHYVEGFNHNSSKLEIVKMQIYSQDSTSNCLIDQNRFCYERVHDKITQLYTVVKWELNAESTYLLKYRFEAVKVTLRLFNISLA